MRRYRPRQYQIDAVQSTLDVLFEQQGKNPIIAMPTGTGKGLVLGMTARAIIQRVPTARVINCTHTKELVGQNAQELQDLWPSAPYGIYSAGLKMKQASMPITFAGIQSAVKNMGAFGRQSIFMIDEAHGLSPNEETNYQRFIKELRKINPAMPVIGYTATPFRMKHGLLTEGNIFDSVAYDATTREAFVKFIDDGYLAPLYPKPTSFQFDVSKVRMLGGDFNPAELQAAVNVDKHTLEALQEALQVAPERNHWMHFCSGIEHIQTVVSMLEAMGESVVYVHSKMGDTQRDLAIATFQAGGARHIVNDGILTTGFNSPWVDCIVLLRPTASPGLHVQILGRGTRAVYAAGFDLDTIDGRLAAMAASCKPNGCLVLDFAGNTMRLGPINDPRIPKKKGKGTGEVPVKICPSCGSYVHAAQRFCDGIHWDNTKCNYEFQFETKIEATAATVELIVRDTPVCEWFKVSRMKYEVITKPFTPAMMQVEYFCGIRRFTELVCIEHDTYAGKKARDWWRRRLNRMGLDVAPPPTTLKGMEFVQHLPEPSHIYVHLNAAGQQGKTIYQNVVATSFDGTTPKVQ